MLEEFSASASSDARAGLDLEFLACPTDQRPLALGILYQRAARDLRPKLVTELLADAASGRLDLSGLWIARRRGRVVAAFLTQDLAGRAAAIWPPEVASFWGRSDLASALIREALNDLKWRGIQVVQALLDGSSPRRSTDDLTRGGVPRVTDLVYLARPTSEPLSIRPDVPQLDWEGFGPETEADFRTVLQASYAGSLDMPELEGARSLDDVLAGHREGGRFQPEHWRIGRIRRSNQAVAVILLTTHPDRDAWEVAYLGLIPSARNRGLGRAALAHALDVTRPATSRLELAVDVRNHPAVKLYRDSGFTPFDRRAVHLAILG